MLPAWSDSLRSKPAPAPAAAASGFRLPNVLPSSAPPVAPMVLPISRVGLVPAQPVNRAAKVVAVANSRMFILPFYALPVASMLQARSDPLVFATDGKLRAECSRAQARVRSLTMLITSQHRW